MSAHSHGYNSAAKKEKCLFNILNFSCVSIVTFLHNTSHYIALGFYITHFAILLFQFFEAYSESL